MQDPPSAAGLLEAVAAMLRDELLPEASGRTAFRLRVAANALDTVRREIELAPAANAAERSRLAALLGEDGDLETLNRRLCASIADGTLGLDTPALVSHLFASTLAKLSIDQPNYASYRQFSEQQDTL